MNRRRAERAIGFCIAVLLTFAAPASAQLRVENAKPVTGIAGAMLFDGQRDLWSLPTVVTFQDDSTFGVCRPENYTIAIDWGNGNGWVGPYNQGRIVKVVQPSPLQPRCEYSAAAPGPPADSQTAAGAQTATGVVSNYAFKQSKPYGYMIRVCRKDTGDCAPPVKNTATITNAEFSVVVLPNLSAASTRSFSGTVALISDKNWYATNDAFKAKITWGDENPNDPPTDGQIEASTNGAFAVTGSHTYKPENTFGARVLRNGDRQFPITVTIDRTGNSNIRATGARAVDDNAHQDISGTMNVSPPPSCPAGTTLQPDGTCAIASHGTLGLNIGPTADNRDPQYRDLAYIREYGLLIHFSGIPFQLQYGVIVKLKGPNKGAPHKTVTLATTVLRLPASADKAPRELKRKWTLRDAVLCQLVPHTNYAITVPDRPGFIAESRTNAFQFRGTTPHCHRSGG